MTTVRVWGRAPVGSRGKAPGRWGPWGFAPEDDNTFFVKIYNFVKVLRMT